MRKVVPLNPYLDTQVSGLRFNCAKQPAVFNEIGALFTLLKIITMQSSSYCLFTRRDGKGLLQISEHFFHNQTDLTQLNDSQTLTKHSIFSCSDSQPLSSTSPFSS